MVNVVLLSVPGSNRDGSNDLLPFISSSARVCSLVESCCRRNLEPRCNQSASQQPQLQMWAADLPLETDAMLAGLRLSICSAHLDPFHSSCQLPGASRQKSLLSNMRQLPMCLFSACHLACFSLQLDFCMGIRSFQNDEMSFSTQSRGLFGPSLFPLVSE